MKDDKDSLQHTHEEYWRNPKKAMCAEAEAWWYANQSGIEVHVDITPHVTVRLTRRQLEDYLRRTKGE